MFVRCCRPRLASIDVPSGTVPSVQVPSSSFFCRPRRIISCGRAALVWRPWFLCRRRRRKEKGVEDEDSNDLELGGINLDPEPKCGANGQDPDECGAGAASAADVPSWQMPKLVVESRGTNDARKHKGTSLILPDAGGDLMAGIVANIPVVLQIRPCWYLGYSMAVDGVSLRTMYRQISDMGPCLLLVEDSNGCIFGAFLSEGLRPVNQCYGTHECFVFRYPRVAGAWRAEIFLAAVTPVPIADGTEGTLEEAEALGEQFEALRKCQAWREASVSTGAVFCDHTGVVIGIDGPGLFIDQDLLRGVSWPCKAFVSPGLAAEHAPEFVVRNLEVWHWGS